MPSLVDRLLDGYTPSPAFGEDLAAYVDQGGMLGLLAYVFVALESADDDLAANVGSQLTVLFVVSSLHDDAIDEAPATNARRFRNERITVGDSAFTRLFDLLESYPGETAPITTAMRDISRGQLAEESVGLDDTDGADPTSLAVDRIDARGSVWGRLLATLIAGTDCYSAAQLERIETIASNLVFVYTVFDDVADLREDVDNDLVTAPLLLLGEQAGAKSPSGEADAAADSVVDSSVPAQLAAIVDRKEREIDRAAAAFHDAGSYDPATVVDAMDRGLSWYDESICTTPLDETVPRAVREEIRRGLTGSDDQRVAFVESTIEASPLPTALVPNVAATVAVVPAEQLVQVGLGVQHVTTLANRRLTTSLDEALAAVSDVGEGAGE